MCTTKTAFIVLTQLSGHGLFENTILLKWQYLDKGYSTYCYSAGHCKAVLTMTVIMKDEWALIILNMSCQGSTAKTVFTVFYSCTVYSFRAIYRLHYNRYYNVLPETFH